MYGKIGELRFGETDCGSELKPGCRQKMLVEHLDDAPHLYSIYLLIPPVILCLHL